MAGYISGTHDKCLKGTRIEVLDVISDWADSTELEDIRAYWLNGGAGIGKSTIAQSFAESCFAKGRLGASFFCSRGSVERSDIRLIIPTLAFQLAYRYPEFRAALLPTIAANADIGHASLTVQVQRLLLEPLKTSGISTIIVIDALDECKDEEAISSILSVLSRIVHEIPSVKIFVTGRPEPRIRSGFRLPLLLPYTNVFRLHDVRSASVDEDIRAYLKTQLPEAVRDRSDLRISEAWPEDKDIAVLVQKCNGLFIFAATTYRFLKSEEDDPRDLLRQVVDLADSTVHEGIMGIDAFYTNIMAVSLSSNRSNTQAVQQRQTILGAITTAFNLLSPFALAKLLNSTTENIRTSLRHLHSVILVPESDTNLIKIYHKSFPDYLTDPNRCTNTTVHINVEVHHAMMARKCLKIMENALKENKYDLPRYAMNKDVDLSALRESYIDDELEYACRFWAHHLNLSSGAGEDLQSTTRLLQAFFEKNLLSWLEILSIIGELRTAIYSLAFLKEWLAKVYHADSSLFNWVNDAERYVLYCFDAIEESAPHIYESSIFWLPTSSLVRKHYSNHLSATIKARNAINPIWDRCTRTISVENEATSVVFSDDGKLIAAIGRIKVIWFLRIFEAATGISVLTIERDDGELYSAAFSRNSSLIFAGSENCKILAWDLQTGGLVQIYEGHAERVESVAVLLNGSSVASGSHDCDVRIWDIASGNCTYILKGHTKYVQSVCWSPAGDWLISGSNDYTIRIWDTTTGLCFNIILYTTTVRSVAYSPDSSFFASGSWDKTMKLYNSSTGTILQSIPTRSHVNSVSFSPCSKQILCGAYSSSFIWDIEKQAIIAQFDQTGINCAAFSPTGTSIVSVSVDSVLRVWQVPDNAHYQLPDASDPSAKSMVTQISHSPDGELLVSGSEDGTIVVWDVAINLRTHTFVGHTGAIQTLAFSPDGALLVSGSKDNTARVWDMHEKRQLWVLEGHNDLFGVKTVQFISNGAHILSQSPWDSMKLWNVETGEMLATMERRTFFMETDGVQVISDRDDSGSSHWAIRGCEFEHFDLTSELPAGFVPTQDREDMYDELPKLQHRYRYLLEHNRILDQCHRTVSWSEGERKWVWSDPDPLAGERFGIDCESLGGGLNEKWVVDWEGRRILWIPQDRRGTSSNRGKKLSIGLEDGRVMTLDFTDV